MNIPEGFEPYYEYLDGITPTPVEGGLMHEGDLFDASKTIPLLPFLDRGQCWHKGWDIPTHWAIDSNKVCWADDAHGGALTPRETKRFLSLLDDEKTEEKVRALLGMKPKMPPWMKTALSNGWTPPESWKKEEWE